MMRFPILAVFITAIVLPAQGAEAPTPSGTNPFQISFGDGADKMPNLSPYEDLKSPFTTAHGLEEQQYEALYARRYRLPLVPPRESSTDAVKAKVDILPPARDGSGHPLWFDGQNGADSLVRLQWLLFARGQFDDLDALYDDWQDPSERMADGRWKLSRFGELYAPPHAAPSDWMIAQEWIRLWRARSPSSPAAAIAEANYWIDYAWDARGEGWSSTVSDGSWTLYTERLKTALNVLEASKPFAGKSPIWGTTLLRISRDLGWPKDHRLAIFSDVVKINKEYDAVYLRMVESLVPKWGGSWRLVERFARDSMRATTKTDGASMYARIYADIAFTEVDPNVLNHTEADWLLLKKGFEDLMVRNSHSAFWMNRFALFACMANDKETYSKVRFQLGDHVDRSNWASGYSPDRCDKTVGPQSL